jgi:gamma-glutamyltranspeptidase/glutathione hydrolase
VPPTLAPFLTVRSAGSMVASADGLATQAGLHVLARGGNAVDAAIATNAVIAVTSPHLCGLGGDPAWHVRSTRSQRGVAAPSTTASSAQGS